MSGDARQSEPPRARDPRSPSLYGGLHGGYAVGASGPTAVAGTGGGSAAGPGGGLALKVDDVLKHVVEGYLLGDLDSMSTDIRPKAVGAVCYPMLMAVLAGSELLGQLAVDGGDAIQRYWATYMARIDDRYGDVAEIAKDLCRNGLAHIYLTKPGVGVVRGEPVRHLVLERTDLLVIDCLELHRDFRASYECFARPAIQGSAEDAQKRLDALVANDAVKSDHLLARLPSERFPVSGLATGVGHRIAPSGTQSISGGPGSV